MLQYWSGKLFAFGKKFKGKGEVAGNGNENGNAGTTSSYGKAEQIYLIKYIIYIIPGKNSKNDGNIYIYIYFKCTFVARKIFYTTDFSASSFGSSFLSSP